MLSKQNRTKPCGRSSGFVSCIVWGSYTKVQFQGGMDYHTGIYLIGFSLMLHNRPLANFQLFFEGYVDNPAGIRCRNRCQRPAAAGRWYSSAPLYGQSSSMRMIRQEGKSLSRRTVQCIFSKPRKSSSVAPARPNRSQVFISDKGLSGRP